MRSSRERRRLGIRLFGVVLLFLVATGQASTDGCAAVPADGAGAAAGEEPAPPAAANPAADSSPAAEAEGRATTGALGTSTRLLPGTWAGTITGGYKGDSIHFVVSPDGRRIEEVVFSGHWRCKDGSSSFSNIKRMDVGHVPGAFALAGDGSFSEEKKEPYLLWTVSGRAEGADRATGTIRIEYATECDTFRLEWAAQPVGR